MPRPTKCRRVCAMPEVKGLEPIGACCSQREVTVLTVDEYEAIRLIDLLGLTQEECAAQMEIARTTVTGIYASARHKLAKALINGNRLLIDGGDFRICDHRGKACEESSTKPCCRRNFYNNQRSKNNDYSGNV